MTRRAWRDHPKACERCGRRGRVERHHLIRSQVVSRHHGDVYDPRNRLVLCPACHPDGPRGSARLPIAAVPDSAFEFAAELLGPGKAYNELRRFHEGEDPRLDALLEAHAA